MCEQMPYKKEQKQRVRERRLFCRCSPALSLSTQIPALEAKGKRKKGGGARKPHVCTCTTFPSRSVANPPRERREVAWRGKKKGKEDEKVHSGSQHRWCVLYYGHRGGVSLVVVPDPSTHADPSLRTLRVQNTHIYGPPVSPLHSRSFTFKTKQTKTASSTTQKRLSGTE
jgi:hypothetical protein